MIVRKQDDGSLMLVAQTEHSRMVGQFAAHWGNPAGDVRDAGGPVFAPPTQWESTVRAAVYHDYGWLRYETEPMLDLASGETPDFLHVPPMDKQFASYQWCVDWLASIDPYSGLLASMHRTGLWRARYGTIAHPVIYNNRTPIPAVDEFVTRNEAWQAGVKAGVDAGELQYNYRLLQVWDLLGLYFGCAEPVVSHIDPVPQAMGTPEGAGVKLTLTPVDGRTVRVDPWPFDIHPLTVQLGCRWLPGSRFTDQAELRREWFKARTGLLEFTLV